VKCIGSDRLRWRKIRAGLGGTVSSPLSSDTSVQNPDEVNQVIF